MNEHHSAFQWLTHESGQTGIHQSWPRCCVIRARIATTCRPRHPRPAESILGGAACVFNFDIIEILDPIDNERNQPGSSKEPDDAVAKYAEVVVQVVHAIPEPSLDGSAPLRSSQASQCHRLE